MHFIILDSEQKRERAIQALASVSLYPMMQVEVKPYKRDRSVAQNRLMWMWITEIAAFTGDDKEDFHEDMKVRFLGVRHVEIHGIDCIIPLNTKTLGVNEFSRKILEPLESLALELGVALTIPDDYSYAMGYEKGRKRA